jgi:hypothetical protein
VDKMKIGTNKMILVNQIDGLDQEGERVQVSVNNTNRRAEFARGRDLKLWAQCIVSGTDKVLLGFDDEYYTLSSIGLHEFQEFSRNADLDGSLSDCLQFQNHLLRWIKAHLPVRSRLFVIR